MRAFPSTRLSSIACHVEVGELFVVFGVEISFYSYPDVSVYGCEKKAPKLSSWTGGQTGGWRMQ